MRAALILLGLAALASLPAHGGPDSSGGGRSGNGMKDEQCETLGRRSYDLCMAGPKADREACLRAYDDTYNRCRYPDAGGDEAKPGTPVDLKLSKNVYRFPYADGNRVHVSRDFNDHNPPGKLDMSGRGGGPYRIVAAAAGTIRFIQDSRSKQQHPERWLRNMRACNNNYVWIEHANGEWSKYSHMQQYTTSGKAGLRVGDKVAAGRYLGDEGKVGCAWPAHLHFEIVRPPDGWKPAIGDPASGELEGWTKSQARNPVIAGVPGKTLKDGENYAVNRPTCKKDDDCDDGEYCNAGVDFTRNSCIAKKSDNETCELVGGGHQCKSGHCRFSRCYTPGGANIGETCYADDACRSGRCSDIDGVKGVCVCNDDADCGSSSSYCDKGIDTKINACRPKLNKGATCGKAGSFGNDHKCKSGECSGFPGYKCK
jgi:hypothetical protein